MPTETKTCKLCKQEYEPWPLRDEHRDCPVRAERRYADDLVARFIPALAAVVPLADLNAAALVAASGHQTWAGLAVGHKPRFAEDVLSTLYADQTRAAAYLDKQAEQHQPVAPTPGRGPQPSGGGGAGFGLGLAAGFMFGGALGE